MLGETRIKGGLAIRVKCKGTGLFCQEKMNLSLRNILSPAELQLSQVMQHRIVLQVIFLKKKGIVSWPVLGNRVFGAICFGLGAVMAGL
jgi:hypothetical protein